VVPENIHNPTTERIGNSGGEESQGGGLEDRFSFQRSFDSIGI